MFTHVLVKWTSGKDAGMMSVLQSDCVRGHDTMIFNDDDGTPANIVDPVVVEWRAGKKPKQGWPVFEARLLKASGYLASFIKLYQ